MQSLHYLLLYHLHSPLARSLLLVVFIRKATGRKDLTPFLAPRIRWDITAKTWEEFPPPQKWFAFGETTAHARYLEARDKVRRRNHSGMIKYVLA
jgi:hypothetical protein